LTPDEPITFTGNLSKESEKFNLEYKLDGFGR